MKVSLYGWLMLAGIGVSVLFWSRLARRDRRLVWIYIAALAGAFIGAKMVYLLAEGWLDWGRPDAWQRLIDSCEVGKGGSGCPAGLRRNCSMAG